MADITLEAVEEVMEKANAEFPAAKKALIDANGDVNAAVSALTQASEPVMDAEYETVSDPVSEQEGKAGNNEADVSETKTNGADNAEAKTAGADNAGAKTTGADNAEAFPADDIIEKLKALVKAGNVDRIVVHRGDDVLLNIPVNVGLLGSVLGLAAAPWAVIAAVVAAFGFSCRIEIVKKDGTKEEVKHGKISSKAADERETAEAAPETETTADAAEETGITEEAAETETTGAAAPETESGMASETAEAAAAAEAATAAEPAEAAPEDSSSESQEQ